MRWTVQHDSPASARDDHPFLGDEEPSEGKFTAMEAWSLLDGWVLT